MTITTEQIKQVTDAKFRYSRTFDAVKNRFINRLDASDGKRIVSYIFFDGSFDPAFKALREEVAGMNLITLPIPEGL